MLSGVFHGYTESIQCSYMSTGCYTFLTKTVAGKIYLKLCLKYHGTLSQLIIEISITILPNVTKYMNQFVKKIPQNKIEQEFWEKSTGLQGWKRWLIFRTGCPEIKAAILVKIWTFYWRYFFLSVDISLSLPLFAFFLSYSKTLKRYYSKLQAITLNMIFQTWQCPFQTHATKVMMLQKDYKSQWTCFQVKHLHQPLS